MATLNKTHCCDCGQLVDACNCNGASAGTECQYKGATAEICGIPEMVAHPQHWYRRRRTTGTMTLSKFLDSVCSGEVSLSASLECQGKGATATLRGISEYIASTPPKKYRRETESGSLVYCNRLVCGAHNDGGPGGWSLSGYRTTDPATGLENFNSTARQGLFGAGGPDPCAVTLGGITSPDIGFPPDPGILANGCATEVKSGNSWVLNATSCCLNPGGAAGYAYVGAVAAELTDEDTEADAIARETDVLDWDGSGGCASQISSRTRTGFIITFRKVQTRFVITSGLVSGGNYEGRIYVGKRMVGSGAAFVDTGAPIIVHFTAAGAGYTSDWKDLPFDEGLEYKAIGIEVFGEIEQLTVDTWNITENVASNTCVETVDNTSGRLVDGSPATGPFDHTPPDAYGALVNVTTTPAARTSNGADDCQADGAGGYIQANGTVTELLDQEDTVEDAAGRAMAAITDWTGGGCNLPAFITARSPGITIFGFRWLQVRAVMTGIVTGHTYHNTWRVLRRPNGSSLPYAYYSDLIQEVTATGPTMDSDWVDVPNEAGWDTIIAGNPKVTLVA